MLDSTSAYCLLAFDVGLKKTGVAVGSSLLGTAEPLRVLRGNPEASMLERVQVLVKEWQPKGFVVGLPKHPDGRDLPNAGRCRHFAKLLRQQFAMPVNFVDETLSSLEARDTARSQGGSGQEDDDAEAAAVILRQYWAEQSQKERNA